MFEKEIIVDGKGHLLGRLASVIAKELVNGQRVVVVRAEQINISGSLYRNKLKMQEQFRKKMRHNPRRGHTHYRAPARVFWKCVRGMMNYTTKRGAAAMARLKTFEGIPTPYDLRKRMVVPQALKVLRLRQFRPFCVLGDLCTQMGWKKAEVVQAGEERRKARSLTFHQKKLDLLKKRKQARNHADLKVNREALAKFGY
mmetsp:Transcript_113776/g.159546  ORF Transcript_113776/g.159546 Transcript_113776/m.159546 type:complete len:199 (+) Transcript_113776:84-680(+)